MKTALSSSAISEDPFFRQKRALRIFQTQRLDRTYADLRKDPEYHDLGKFFFEDLYSHEDNGLQDTSIRKLHNALRGKIHRGVIAAVDQVLELHELSEDLDERMTAEMLDAGLGPDFTLDQYCEIYRSLDNYNQRLQQVDLAMDVTGAFFRLSRKWMIGVSLKTARTAAHLMGLNQIMDLIYRGYGALQKVQRIDPFVDTVRRREYEFNNKIFGAAR